VLRSTISAAYRLAEFEVATTGITVCFRHKRTVTLYCPTDAHSVKNVELLKHIKIMEAAPTCFGLQRNHHQGSTASN
jgi:hypothetical protein